MRVPAHTVDDAPGRSQELLKSLEEKHGKVLNIHGAMAHAPALLDLYVSAEQAIAENTSLERSVRDAIHLAVAAVNDCAYCQSAYTAACKRSGFSEEQTVAIRKGGVDWDDRLAVLLEVSREAAARKGYVDDGTWQAALDAGWSDQQVLEAFADTVRTILTNYFNHLVRTDLDLPAAPGID